MQNEEAYKLLEELADLIIEKYNPCKKEWKVCLNPNHFTCCTRTAFKREDKADTRCLYLSDTGCLNPNLRCKSWLCKTALEVPENKECIEILKAIELIGIKFGFIQHPYLGERYAGISNG
jgi:hypothetical protein